MDQITTLSTLSNPFEKIDPIYNYMSFQNIIGNIKDRNLLVEIGKMLEKKLRELSEFSELN
jgi:hypothetical protein